MDGHTLQHQAGSLSAKLRLLGWTTM